ncbi:hypothetical protein C5Y97_25195 [Blastopirellula marina]|uniref:Uncharacterized protein n=1 Tax=Blastopirellula marina TaxID=124 RepID=A0A2S8F7R7_9BACT|nr:hypothetical protein C5Y98_25180 [Blastopirellula marina]PTL41736.1 hypothetical protein C5Y97_25195 [Blastopirellula marina]
MSKPKFYEEFGFDRSGPQAHVTELKSSGANWVLTEGYRFNSRVRKTICRTLKNDDSVVLMWPEHCDANIRAKRYAALLRINVH